jgi:exodeoxyribonuclease VII large subunit
MADITPRADVLEVGEFYELLTTHLESGFGRRHPRWVRGEIEKLYDKTHLYLDVVDAGPSTENPRPVLKVRCWASVWNPLKKDLAARGIALKEGTVLTFKGYVGLYRPRGEVSFAVSEIDVEGLEGDQARARQALIQRLQAEGVFDAQKSLSTPPVPLRVGLIASPRTEGFSDFTGQLIGSPFGFHVSLVAVTVQGENAPREIVAALDALEPLGLDVICIVRGGGSRGDLACFDDEAIARRIAGSSVPVVTGIGHTGDVAVADLTAHHAAITPTKLGEFLVTRVGEWYEQHVARPSEVLERATRAVVSEATEYVAERRRTTVLAVRDRLASEQTHLDHLGGALVRHARHLVETQSRNLAATRSLLAAYDPQRRLAQGWSIVTSASGDLVRTTADLRPGDPITVRVADGSFGATVDGGTGRLL